MNNFWFHGSLNTPFLLQLLLPSFFSIQKNNNIAAEAEAVAAMVMAQTQQQS